MDFSDVPSPPLGPLNPGDVVSAALKLYRDRFKTYLQLSALATLWVLAGIVGMALAIAVLAGGLWAIGGEVLGVVGGFLGMLVGFLPLLYGSAKYTMILSVIGRLAFRDLINQPETSLDVRRALTPKLNQFLLLSFLLSLAYSAALMVSLLVASLAGAGVGVVIGGLLGAFTNSAVGGVVGTILGVLLWIAVFTLGLVWIISHLLIPDVVLAVEPNQDAGSSLSRSWELTQTSLGRIQIVLLATFLIQLPVLSVTNYLPSIFFAFLPDSVTVMAISQGIGFILSLAGNMLILPLWQAVKGVLYYDLRSRREGLDLELR
ncbi:hypothetical protein GFS31_27220 [Leptolyngbya sp. BL0902]|uniref:hypothetical protein n=1 Tax=Leptolyngbya sp. BL0902 TaxID=1115757 RepID=UPI0018E8A3C4|nr:hypothetical protein [Leptolyngbya sp. BL0902]QQE66027.1 hypothetical protein GFS31_27220 [Leptolyngbya sp. BL0902]